MKAARNEGARREPWDEDRLEERLRAEARACAAPPADLAARVRGAVRAQAAAGGADGLGGPGGETSWKRLVPLLAAAAAVVLLLARAYVAPARAPASTSSAAPAPIASTASPAPERFGGVPAFLSGPLTAYDDAPPALRTVVDEPLRVELASLWSEGARAARGVVALVPAPLRESLRRRPN